MKTEKLDYHLPSELVAQRPLRNRSDSRLLVLNRSSGTVIDSRFNHVGDFLLPADCFVLNDTKVLPGRFFGRRDSGGRLEGLFLAESAVGTWEVMLKSAAKVKTGETIYLKDKTKGDFCQAVVVQKKGEGKCRLKIEADASLETILDEIGFPPLPPYIKRTDNLAVAAIDKVRYQTVYARKAGAVAAPTAGLHFTKELIGQLEKGGICFAYVTLHVGLGTFKPIATEYLKDHEIDEERYSIDAKNARMMNAAKTRGKRIIAVGTTSVRVLESVAVGSQVRACRGSTKLFIKPDYKFKMVDAMITNFHLPKSSLLALVAAFAGLENILAAYCHAVEQRYRFYSYGDVMLIT